MTERKILKRKDFRRIKRLQTKGRTAGAIVKLTGWSRRTVGRVLESISYRDLREMRNNPDEVMGLEDSSDTNQLPLTPETPEYPGLVRPLWAQPAIIISLGVVMVFFITSLLIVVSK
ncbi:MAG TPA: hypothetical protein VFT87_01060 [Candidatus Saccharimonadales bacterium]|nr:hypothetical protein [Candidatus Saccharimonadales bacterium]